MSTTFKIIYTSDTHGRISAYDFTKKSYGLFGLSRLSSYLKSVKEPYLLLDNGDFLQGSPLIDYARKNGLKNPVARIFNALNYQYVTVGNHDFNFGLDYLKSFQNAFNGQILCSNIYTQNENYFTPFAIHEINGVKIGIIGLTTEYIPFWERKENIHDLEFRDVVSEVNEIIKTYDLTVKTDLILLLYHGGYEKNVTIQESYSNVTIENKGAALFDIPNVDIVLTGHQHVAQIHQKGHHITMQTSFNAHDFGVIDIVMGKNNQGYEIEQLTPEIIKLDQFPVDESVEYILKDLVKDASTYLDQTIGSTQTDMTIKSPLEARIIKHPLFQLVNEIQLAYTSADISCSSLPNQTNGFLPTITLNDIATNFPFENDLLVIEVTGDMLISALEQNSTYFKVLDQHITVNPKFLHPKVEHYNYDVYDGITYEMHINNPVGNRIKNVYIKNQPLDLTKTYRLALNSYRATGAGGFDMFKKAEVIMSYPVSYFDLISQYVIENQNFKIDTIQNFKIVY
ncbi:MAG: bifunctional UDP-sugar hydrolase/5'-nucleotidase [Bacteroidales bacterium]|nr:bifunctional UDP-sugar hydrolase/5'-nucleotidase [Bacteroidales bacterium]